MERSWRTVVLIGVANKARYGLLLFYLTNSMSGLHGIPSGMPALLLVRQPMQVAHLILGGINEWTLSD